MRRVFGLILVAVGIALALVAGFADRIGISDTPDKFGGKQAVGVVVGVYAVLVGLFLAVTATGWQRGEDR